MASTGLIPGAQDWIKAKAREAIEKLPEVKEVAVEYNEVKAKGMGRVRCDLLHPPGETSEPA